MWWGSGGSLGPASHTLELGGGWSREEGEGFRHWTQPPLSPERREESGRAWLRRGAAPRVRRSPQAARLLGGGRATCSGEPGPFCAAGYCPSQVAASASLTRALSTGAAGARTAQAAGHGARAGEPVKGGTHSAITCDGACSQDPARAVRPAVQGVRVAYLTGVSSSGLSRAARAEVLGSWGPSRASSHLGPCGGPEAACVHQMLPRRQRPQVRGHSPHSPEPPTHRSLNTLQSGTFLGGPGWP